MNKPTLEAEDPLLAKHEPVMIMRLRRKSLRPMLDYWVHLDPWSGKAGSISDELMLPTEWGLLRTLFITGLAAL